MPKSLFSYAVISEKGTIKQAMRQIDHSGLRVVYIVNKDRRLLGIVSDSEIRKAILRGCDIEDTVGKILNPAPIVLLESELAEISAARSKVRILQKKMPDSRHILLVNGNGQPVRLVPCAEILGSERSLKSLRRTRNVLVVGGAGYLGSILVDKLLARGYSVQVLDRLAFGVNPLEGVAQNSGRLSFISGDMRNISTLSQALAGMDAVINLAAIVGDPACKNTPEMTIETNFLANKVLAEACRFHQINRFIYASTCSVYGVMDGEKKLDETSPLNPVSLYARSKIQSEQGILSLVDENFAPTILRMGTLHGFSRRMRFDLVVNAMTKAAMTEGKIQVHAGGKQWRPLLHVEDAAEAYIACLEAPLEKVRGEIFNIGSEKQNFQIIQIAKAVQREVPSAKIVIESGGDDPRNYFVSFNKIKKALGYTTSVTVEESVKTIRRAIENGTIRDLNHSRYYNLEPQKTFN